MAIITHKVETSLKKAMSSFSKKLNVLPTDFMFYIKTKNTDGNLSPMFFYGIKNMPQKDEKGNLKQVNVITDILEKKVNFFSLTTLALVDKFIMDSFMGFSEKFKIDPQSLFVSISCYENEIDNLKLKLIGKNQEKQFLLKSSDYNLKSKPECNTEEWNAIKEKKQSYSEQEWKEMRAKEFNLGELLGEPAELI